MSGLPIISPLNTAQLPSRDITGVAQMQPAQATTNAVRTIMASAVNQTTNLDQADKTARKVLASSQEKRARLVGPPPTFEVNVLQHMQETRMDRALEMPAGEDADPIDEPAQQTEAEEIRMPDTAYQSYAKMSGGDEGTGLSAVDKSV